LPCRHESFERSNCSDYFTSIDILCAVQGCRQQFTQLAKSIMAALFESSYDPYAQSEVGATGLWQLMPDTAADLRIKSNAVFSAQAKKYELAYFADQGETRQCHHSRQNFGKTEYSSLAR